MSALPSVLGSPQASYGIQSNPVPVSRPPSFSSEADGLFQFDRLVRRHAYHFHSRLCLSLRRMCTCDELYVAGLSGLLGYVRRVLANATILDHPRFRLACIRNAMRSWMQAEGLWANPDRPSGLKGRTRVMQSEIFWRRQPSSSGIPSELVERSSLWDELRDCLADFPGAYAVLERVYRQGDSFSAAGRALGIPTCRVENLHAVIMSRGRELFGESGFASDALVVADVGERLGWKSHRRQMQNESNLRYAMTRYITPEQKQAKRLENLRYADRRRELNRQRAAARVCGVTVQGKAVSIA